MINTYPSLQRLPQSVCTQPILLVDDSLFQRELGKELLGELGCEQVSVVEDGEQALQHLRSCAGDWPLLLVDLEMPRMNGLQLLQVLADEEIRPQVVIVSGSDERRISLVESLASIRGLPILGSLEKPVSAARLHQVLRLSQPKFSALL